MIESDYAVNFGTGQIEAPGNLRNRAFGDVPQCRLDGVQHFDEWPGTAFQLPDDAEDGFGVVWGQCMSHATGNVTARTARQPIDDANPCYRTGLYVAGFISAGDRRTGCVNSTALRQNGEPAHHGGLIH
jgi:hypothetical protein